MSASHIIALDEYHVLEIINTNVGFSMSTEPIYVHPIEQGVQLLNKDGSAIGNDRQRSYYAEVGNTTENYKLDPTPFSYSELDAAKHAPSQFLFDYGAGDVVPTYLMEYKLCRLHVVNGYSFAQDSVADALEIMLTYGEREIRLINLYNARGESRYKPNSYTLAYQNKLYTSSVEFYIVDFEAILEDDAQEMIEFRKLLFDVANDAAINRNLLSSYQIKYAEIPGDSLESIELSGANTSNVQYPFDRFSINEWSETFKLRAEYADGLTNRLSVQKSGDNYIVELGLQHDNLTVQEALGNLGNIDFLTVEHSLSLQEFDNLGDSLGIRKLSLQNKELYYDNLQFRPIIKSSTETIVAQLRTIIRFIDADVEINRFVTVVLTQQMVDQLRQSVTLENFTLATTEIVNQIQTQQLQVNSAASISGKINVSLTDNMSFVSITQVKVDDALQQIDEIALNVPSSLKTFEFKFMSGNSAVSLNSITRLYIKIGEQTFEEVSRPNDIAVRFRIQNPDKLRSFEMYDQRQRLIAQGALVDTELVNQAIAAQILAIERQKQADAERIASESTIAALTAAKNAIQSQDDFRALLEDRNLVDTLTSILNTTN